MTFVGKTIIYAYMQAIGMVNDHLRGCWLRGGLQTFLSGVKTPVPLSSCDTPQEEIDIGTLDPS